MQSFSARLAAVRDLTYDVREINLALVDPPEMRFHAGQFVSFEIDRPGSRIPATRPYSIASIPTDTKGVAPQGASCLSSSARLRQWPTLTCICAETFDVRDVRDTIQKGLRPIYTD